MVMNKSKQFAKHLLQLDLIQQIIQIYLIISYAKNFSLDKIFLEIYQKTLFVCFSWVLLIMMSCYSHPF